MSRRGRLWDVLAQQKHRCLSENAQVAFDASACFCNSSCTCRLNNVHDATVCASNQMSVVVFGGGPSPKHASFLPTECGDLVQKEMAFQHRLQVSLAVTLNA